MVCPLWVRRWGSTIMNSAVRAEAYPIRQRNPIAGPDPYGRGRTPKTVAVKSRPNDGASGPVAVLGSGGFGWLHADEEGHLEPLPVAVDVVEAELAQPPELGLHVEQAVGGVLFTALRADRRQEGQV